jgi:hypothetical protein
MVLNGDNIAMFFISINSSDWIENVLMRRTAILHNHPAIKHRCEKNETIKTGM